jgi:EEF1A lysine methyltransferase 4
MVADFEKQSYWHDRFAHESSFDWLVPSSTFLDVMEPHIAHLPRSAAILNVGSGTSDLHNGLRARGFSNVTNLDYEPLAADRGRELEAAAFGDVKMGYVVADATRLADPAYSSEHHGQYQVILDKSTSDAIACGGEDPMLSMAEGVARCLADGGVWLCLSFSSSRFEVPGFPLDVSVVDKIPTPKLRSTDPDIFYWCYALRPR